MYVRGRPFKAFDVYEEMLATGESTAEAAEAWHLPQDAIDEIVRYCKENQDLLKEESLEDHHRTESLHRLSSSARRSLKAFSYGVLALIPVLLIVALRDWLLYAICTILFIGFLRFAKDLPIIGKAWVSLFGDNSLFEWIKITVIPVSVLFLGASITNAINSRQSEANIEKSRYEITQKYLDMFIPNSDSAKSVAKARQEVTQALASNRDLRPQVQVKEDYRLSSRCYVFPESAWLSNLTSLALSQLSGMQINSNSITAQKKYILQYIQRDGLIKAGGNVISLHHADLSDSNLVLADMRNSCLESVLFSDYAGTPSSSSDLRHIKLDGSDLTGASLRNANLRAASLRQVDLRGFASLRGSDLRGADLSGARIDRSTVLIGARLNTRPLKVEDHKKSWLYNKLCLSGIRRYLRKTYYCLDNIDYINLAPTKLPSFCSPSRGCQQADLSLMQKRGAVIVNSLPYQ